MRRLHTEVKMKVQHSILAANRGIQDTHNEDGRRKGIQTICFWCECGNCSSVRLMVFNSSTRTLCTLRVPYVCQCCVRPIFLRLPHFFLRFCLSSVSHPILNVMMMVMTMVSVPFSAAFTAFDRILCAFA